MKVSHKITALGVVVILILLLSVAGYGSLFAIKNRSAEGVVFNVPEGVTLRWIAQSLEDQGLINNSTLFIVAGKFILPEKEIMAGEYLFSRGMSLFDILSAFKYGWVNYHKVTIPAGYNVGQIGHILESEGLLDKKTFKALTKDRELINSLNMDIPSLEGFLYPDTYYFLKGGEPGKKVRKMLERFQEVFDQDLEVRAAELDMSIKDVVTLASLIEKEAAVQKERPIISAVFHNRLKKNMRLQSDPTVIYALGDSFKGNLKRKHLRFSSSYNTYIRRGLPPGPIGSPAIESIRAALYPADVNYLYFVSKNNGTHYFSKTLKEHNRAVAIYQKKLASSKTSR